ncbi:MAG TPA: hypothetical protein VEB86_11940 [Chryseosolibacter sp.]|nr:hypothetical protein [Chryseosolibacter sp.]
MGPTTRQYLFGLIFIGVAIYQVSVGDYLETSLYGLGGLAFIVNALTVEPKLVIYKRPLVVVSWVLIISTGLLFLYLLQFKYL